ncbi:MAG: hypothetical protein IPL53_25020 [Ignavibacteria bacterium]|nr:hypothetical protein [Ignavibacteria bacterium]
MMFAIPASLIAGIFANIPEIFQADETVFYSRNIGFIALLMITIYFGWVGNLTKRKIIAAASAFLASAVFINLIP